MLSIINDIEEYDQKFYSNDNGFDNHEWDNWEYLDLANQTGLKPVLGGGK